MPWIIETVFLFATNQLIKSLKVRRVKVGIATSVVSRLWEKARIYPQQNDTQLVLTDDQIEKLSLFK